MRIDAQEAVERAAEFSAAVNDIYLAQVSGEFITEEWSEPVQVRAVPTEKIGLVEFQIRRVDAA
jgi:hypothetical protein